MRGWSTGAIIWLVLAILFALGGATCSRAEGGWGGFVWMNVTLLLICLGGLTYSYWAARGKRRQALMSLAICLALLVAWVWLRPFAWWFDTVGFGNQPFDSAVWRQTKSADYGISPANPRGTMLRSLLRSGRLKRATKQEVRAALGPPDQPGWHLTGVGEHWDYEIGWFTGFQMDPDFLVIDFDREGRVSGWSIVQS